MYFYPRQLKESSRAVIIKLVSNDGVLDHFYSFWFWVDFQLFLKKPLEFIPLCLDFFKAFRYIPRGMLDQNFTIIMASYDFYRIILMFYVLDEIGRYWKRDDT